MLSNSLNSKGATPGFLSSSLQKPIPKSPTGLVSQNGQPFTMPSLGDNSIGTNPGLLPGVNSSSQQKVTTVSPTGSTTTTHPAQSNPSVLAQQQALNKLGAGLVEDGIAGPKTSAAIAKYGNTTNSSSGGSQSSTGAIPTNTASDKFDRTTGQPNSGYIDPNAPKTSPTDFPEFVKALGDQGGSQYNQTVQNSAHSLQDISQTNPGNSGPAYDDYQEAIKNLNDLKAKIAGQTGGIESQPISMQFQQGKEQALARQNASLIDAAQQAVNEKAAALGYQISGTQTQQTGLNEAGGLALSGQSTAQGALGTAGSLSQPTGNIINVDPITGLPVAGGSLGNLANIAGTVQGIQSGAAASAAAGGNISAQNQTALGTAATGANARSIGDFTNQINTTQKSVQTLDNLANQIVPNMGTTGFNPSSSPIGNQTFAQYFTEKNPAAKAGIVAGLGEIKNQISNVIASATGLTPTGVTAVTDTYDLTTLNPQQLSDFLQYINQYAQSNIKAAQDSISTIQKGGSSQANPGILPAPTANSTGQAISGTGATLAKGLINQIVSHAGSIIAGAVGGGLAEKILK